MTKATTWRKERGAATQRFVAVQYQAIYPGAMSAGAGASGRDVLNVPLSIEVKAPHKVEVQSWLRQAEGYRTDEDDLPPHVVYRPDKLGEAHWQQWIVLRYWGHDLAMMRELVELRRAAEGPASWSAPMDGPFG